MFETNDREIKIPVSIENETVWLSANQMAVLFDRDEKTIRKHINNVFTDGELDKDNNTQKMRVEGVKQRVPFYSALVAITLMIAESNPDEKDIMTTLVMNLLSI